MPPICIVILLSFVSQCFWENLGGCGHWDAPHPLQVSLKHQQLERVQQEMAKTRKKYDTQLVALTEDICKLTGQIAEKDAGIAFLQDQRLKCGHCGKLNPLGKLLSAELSVTIFLRLRLQFSEAGEKIEAFFPPRKPCDFSLRRKSLAIAILLAIFRGKKRPHSRLATETLATEIRGAGRFAIAICCALRC